MTVHPKQMTPRKINETQNNSSAYWSERRSRDDLTYNFISGERINGPKQQATWPTKMKENNATFQVFSSLLNEFPDAPGVTAIF